MILKIALLLLYLVVGLWLFVTAVSELGGINNISEYKNRLVLVLGLLLTVIFWPIFIIQAFFQRRK